MKLPIIHIIGGVLKYNISHSGVAVVILTLICCAQLSGQDFMYWESNFSPITLLNIENRDRVREGSSFTTLFTSGDAEISADNTAAARLNGPGGDGLYTEYKLEFDGDGSSETGRATVDFTSYDSFLSPAVLVTYVPDDNDVQVTLSVRASNYPNELANAGEYTATQTLTVYWVGP